MRQYGKINKYQLSKSLIDEILSGSGGGGTASISIKKFTRTINTPTNKIEIGSLYFTKETDHLLVFKNSVYLEEEVDYIINSDNTISKSDGTQWIASTNEPTVFNFICLMNIPEEKELHGKKLVDHSVSENKLDIELRDKINNIRSSSTYLSSNNDISITDWSEVNAEGLYTARLNHNLNSEDLMVTIIDKDTKRNIMFSCKSVDVNTIELEVTKKANVRVLVINTNSSTFGDLIDDDNIHNNKTLSSEKIYSTFALKNENTGGGEETGRGSVFKTSLTTSSWITDGNLKKCTINHNLNTNDIIDVVGYNTSTKNNILLENVTVIFLL